ncbi:twin-arginine translocase TatA/TatE family subunit [Geotalea uraniireducens]|uniref:twin-arginine translocase TatA/TatE family subunit n=1 Tax=Geotalea uraniireducens TaxID=351604 RepID=UPI0012EDB333|nr:twin-arginine translocase TatA/TatE family subunit [Geotalea uraniireducens]
MCCLSLCDFAITNGKLPQLGASLGGAIRSFKKAAEEEPKLANPKEVEKKDQ